MSNITFQIQYLKNQIKNIEFQLDNIIAIQNMNGIQNYGNQLQNMGILIINIGIQMINDGIQMPNMGMDTSYLMQQIMNIDIQIQNIRMQINNNMGMNMNNNMGMNMNNNNMGMNMNNNMAINMNNNNMGMNMNNNNMAMNMNNNNMGMNMNNNNMGMNVDNNIGKIEDNIEKMTITFRTSKGETKNITVDYGISIADLLNKYLKAINHHGDVNEIGFLFNACKLNLEDETKIEEKFKYTIRPLIIVYQVNNIK